MEEITKKVMPISEILPSLTPEQQMKVLTQRNYKIDLELRADRKTLQSILRRRGLTDSREGDEKDASVLSSRIESLEEELFLNQVKLEETRLESLEKPLTPKQRAAKIIEINNDMRDISYEIQELADTLNFLLGQQLVLSPNGNGKSHEREKEIAKLRSRIAIYESQLDSLRPMIEDLGRN